MALFEPHYSRDREELLGSDVATRALSVIAVENSFVAGVYEKLASVYDFTFGPTLHPGRVQAIQRMGIKPGDRVLEVGVGTAINASLYPRDCAVTGTIRPAPCSEHDCGAGIRYPPHQMTPPTSFFDGHLDIVYAPIHERRPDPIAVACERAPAGSAAASSSRITSAVRNLLGWTSAKFTLHRPYRLQVGSRPAALCRAGGANFVD